MLFRTPGIAIAHLSETINGLTIVSAANPKKKNRKTAKKNETIENEVSRSRGDSERTEDEQNRCD